MTDRQIVNLIVGAGTLIGLLLPVICIVVLAYWRRFETRRAVREIRVARARARHDS